LAKRLWARFGPPLASEWLALLALPPELEVELLVPAKPVGHPQQLVQVLAL
jgi:hypothetical protein